MTFNDREWIIIEHEEYVRTIGLTPSWVRDFIENELRPKMRVYPFTNAIRLKNKLEGFYEQKIGNYRLVFRVNLQTRKVEYCWVRAKPHATAQNFIE